MDILASDDFKTALDKEIKKFSEVFDRRQKRANKKEE